MEEDERIFFDVICSRNLARIETYIRAQKDALAEIERDAWVLLKKLTPMSRPDILRFLTQSGVDLEVSESGDLIPSDMILMLDVMHHALFFHVGAKPVDSKFQLWANIAAIKGYCTVIVALLKCGRSVTAIYDPYSMLRYSAKHGRGAAVQLQLKMGASVEEDESSPFWSPLCAAVRSGDPKSVYVLVKAGAFDYVQLCQFVTKCDDQEVVSFVKGRLEDYEKARAAETYERERNNPEYLRKKLEELRSENRQLRGITVGDQISQLNNPQEQPVDMTNGFPLALSPGDVHNYEEIRRLEGERESEDRQSRISALQSDSSSFFRSTVPKALAQHLANVITNQHENRTGVSLASEDETLEIAFSSEGNAEKDLVLQELLRTLLGEAYQAENNVVRIEWSCLTEKILVELRLAYESELPGGNDQQRIFESKHEAVP